MGFLRIARAETQERGFPFYVFYKEEGKLTYTPDTMGNVISDFRNPGYRYGDVLIPDIHFSAEVSHPGEEEEESSKIIPADLIRM